MTASILLIKNYLLDLKMKNECSGLLPSLIIIISLMKKKHVNVEKKSFKKN